MIILLTAVGLLVIGVELTLRAWPSGSETAPRAFERITHAAVIALGIWLGTTWALALVHQLTKPMLIARAVIAVVIAAVLLAKRVRHAPQIHVDKKVVLVCAIALLPVLVWVEFILWRGAIVPPLSHDALSYHLPKAVFFARAEGFEYLRDMDARQRNIPANYEMLLTEFVVTQQSDKYSEWPSAAFYLLFAIACAAIAERWTKNRNAALIVFTLTCATPVLLLHSGAHKNDLLIGFLTVASMLAAGRFIAERQLSALLICIAATAMAIGTKPQAAAVALFLAPFIFWRLRVKARVFAGIVAFGITALLLLGGAVYLINFLNERAIVGEMKSGEAVIQYGDWRNLWEGPYVLLAAPFSRSARELRVPWEEQPWFWRGYEIYFSHLGIPFALCAIAAPFAAIALRRKGDRNLERMAVTLAALAAFALMLPVVFKPHGFYAISLPRYALFLVPIVYGWTIAPLAARLKPALALGLLVIVVGAFAFYAIDNAVNDDFTPLDYVMWAKERPGTRAVAFDPRRAASVIDELAGPNDVVAFDSVYAAWLHPAFGANLTRPLVLIPPSEGPPRIPDNVEWVGVDRMFAAVWETGGFEDLSQVQTRQGGEERAGENMRLARYLANDPRWKLVFARDEAMQFVFRRVR